MSLDQEDLSKTFGNPLAGRLRRSSAVATPPQPQTDTSISAQPMPDPAPVPPAPVQAQTPRNQEIAGTATVQVSVYVNSALAKAIKAQRRGRTNARIVFDAIDATHNQLPALLAARQTPASGSLFTPQASDYNDANLRVLWTFKATVVNLKVIDELATKVGAASRSQLVGVALEAHLLNRRDAH